MHGVPGEFADLMDEHGCVVSGSAIFEFIDDDETDKWDGFGCEVHDLDIYVPNGKLTEILTFLLVAPASPDARLAKLNSR